MLEDFQLNKWKAELTLSQRSKLLSIINGIKSKPSEFKVYSQSNQEGQKSPHTRLPRDSGFNNTGNIEPISNQPDQMMLKNNSALFKITRMSLISSSEKEESLKRQPTQDNEYIYENKPVKFIYKTVTYKLLFSSSSIYTLTLN